MPPITRIAFLIPLLLSLALPACMSTSPASEQIDWHRQRLSALRAEDGWLTLVGLDFLSEGSQTIGNCGGATFSYPNCADPIVGRLDVDGDTVRFTPNGANEPTLLTSDDVGAPSVIRSGSVSFTLVRRNGRLALRVKDNASPVRTDFTGIELFPFDPSLVVEARALPPAGGERVSITNVRGFVEEQPVAATLDFSLGGAPQRLIATSGSNGRLFVVFADATNGGETYGGGRFLDLPAPRSGVVSIDFNKAYNPPCCFTAFATCPLPPASNRLALAVRAGERAPITSDSNRH
ncbi:MAG: hypothetical protein RIS45_1328 [Planctomycetota bacterium]